MTGTTLILESEVGSVSIPWHLPETPLSREASTACVLGQLQVRGRQTGKGLLLAAQCLGLACGSGAAEGVPAQFCSSAGPPCWPDLLRALASGQSLPFPIEIPILMSFCGKIPPEEPHPPPSAADKDLECDLPAPPCICLPVSRTLLCSLRTH